MSKFIAYLTEQDGFSAAEYALSFAVVGVVATMAAGAVGGFLSSFAGNSAGMINELAGCLRSHSHITAC